MAGVCIRWSRGNTDTRGTLCDFGGRDHVMRPQAEGGWQPSEAGKARKDPPVGPSEGVYLCPRLDFRLLGPKTEGINTFLLC